MATWNQALLRSGLPFEFVIAKLLAEAGFVNFGEFPYTRTERDGRETESSVDLQATYTIGTDVTFADSSNARPPRLDLNVLVECKYSESKCHWVFAPRVHGDISEAGFAVVDDYSAWAAVPAATLPFHPDTIYCLKGTALYDGDSQSNTIDRGLNQLRYGIPYETASAIEEQHMWVSDDGGHVAICVPILVTSSELRVLSQNLEIQQIKDAKSIEEISTPTSLIVVSTRLGPDLTQHLENVNKKFTEAEVRDELRKVRQEKNTNLRKASLMRGMRLPRMLIRSAPKYVYVVNHQYLPVLLKHMISNATKIHSKLKQALDVDDHPMPDF